MAENDEKTNTLVLCVHGIGEQKAGDTIDTLAAALEKNEAARVESECRWLVDEYKIPGSVESRFQDHFQCHIRAFDTNEQRTTYAEVFWADLSRPRHGMVGVLYELILTVLGMGNIVRENVYAAYGKGSASASLAGLFIGLMHACIAPLNLLLLAVVLLQLNEKVRTEPLLVMGLIWLGLIVSWLFGKKGPFDSHLFNQFKAGLVIFAMALSLIALVATICPLAIPEAITGPQIGDRTLSLPLDGKQDVLSASLIAALLMLSALTALVVGILMLHALTRTIRAKLTGRPARKAESVVMFETVCTIMALLWATLSMAFWSIAVPALGDRPHTEDDTNIQAEIETGYIGINTSLFEIPLMVFPYLVVALLLVILSLVVIYLFRNSRLNELNGTLDQATDIRETEDQECFRATRNRLLLNGRLSIIICAMPVIIVGLLGLLYGVLGRTLVDEWLFISVPIFVGVCGYVFSAQRSGLSMALGVGKDVITYLKRERLPSNRNIWFHPQRERIHQRFKTVARTMIESTKADKVVVVSHSLGTLVAVQSIKELLSESENHQYFRSDLEWSALITMGSPLTHLFEHYFGSTFAVPNGLFKEKIPTWKNIFCIDDFVGTTVGNPKGDWPLNYAVKKSGHTEYWKDRHTLDLIRHHI
ncbi:hypothetical protein [Coralliovum pocilloporae]|uniref:hypothetical protein n=1 Tax=Coralliovum pocilloporae TaxID=3066369 RepID=UPI003307AA01